MTPAGMVQNNSPAHPDKDYCWVTEALAEYLIEYNAKKTINSGSSSVLDLTLKENK